MYAPRYARDVANPLDKDRLLREAFDALFSRIASMVYPSTSNGKWGLIRRKLPEPQKAIFQEFIDTLHIKYFLSLENV